MFSGKTRELLNLVERVELANRTVWLFKPQVDDRYSTFEVVSHNGDKRTAKHLIGKDLTEVIQMLEDECIKPHLAFDEAQFLGPEFVDFVLWALANGYHIDVAGLDLDAFAQPWSPISELLAIAESIDKRKAICMKCGNDASRTQRLDEGGEPVTNGELVQVGGKDTYEPRCVGCFVSAHVTQGVPA